LYDSFSHHTHFTGWMLEEEIVASLWVFSFDKKKLSLRYIYIRRSLTI
jgi:hypothetical protein